MFVKKESQHIIQLSGVEKKFQIRSQSHILLFNFEQRINTISTFYICIGNKVRQGCLEVTYYN